MIDVIIPCFNSIKTLDKTLQSIVTQSIKDKINVLLIDDCSSCSYDSFIDLYSKYIKIKLIKLNKNLGPGVAREQGMLATKNKYITFIDSDDFFYTSDALEQLLNKIEEGYDYVNSIEFEQKNKRYSLLNCNVHGKLYRRKYLKDNNINFINTMYHEDNYFNNLVILSGAKIGKIDTCTYYYTYNKSSITNVGEDAFPRLKIYIDNMNELIQISKDNKYNKNRVIRLIDEELFYLRNIYNSINSKNKKTLIKWLKESNPDYLDIIFLDDLEFTNKLLFYTLDYIEE